MNPVLEINVELKRNVSMSSKLKKEVAGSVVRELRSKNSEYSYLYSLEKEKVYPKIVGWPYHHPKYFCGNGKQEWVKK